MYPYQMKTQLIPYGEPVLDTVNTNMIVNIPLYIQSIISTFRLKRICSNSYGKNRLFAQIDYMSVGTSEN